MATCPHCRMCVLWSEFDIVPAPHSVLQCPKPPGGGALVPTQQSNLTTDTADTVSVRILSRSHSSFWDPRMVRISLNRSHHLTRHTVVLLIDSIHAEKVTHLKLLLPHQSFLPPSTFFPACSFYSSCVHCYLCAVFLSSTDVIYSSNSSYWTVCHISWTGWMDSLHLSPLSLSVSPPHPPPSPLPPLVAQLSLDERAEVGGGGGSFSSSVRLMSHDWKSMTPVVACRVVDDGGCPNINVRHIHIGVGEQYEEARHAVCEHQDTCLLREHTFRTFHLFNVTQRKKKLLQKVNKNILGYIKLSHNLIKYQIWTVCIKAFIAYLAKWKQEKKVLVCK